MPYGEEVLRLDETKISGYEDYRAEKVTKEAFMERKKTLDARKQELSVAVSEMEA